MGFTHEWSSAFFHAPLYIFYLTIIHCCLLLIIPPFVWLFFCILDYWFITSSIYVAFFFFIIIIIIIIIIVYYNECACSMRRWWYVHACTKVHSFTQYFVSIAVAIFRTRVPRTKRSLKIHTRNQRRERLLGEPEQGGNCSILLRGNPFLTIW